MEGRFNLPDAKHNFPNNPNLRKFWGTPQSKSFFGIVGVVFGSFTVFLGLNSYLCRNEVGPYGYDLKLTDEQMDRKIELIRTKSEVRKLQLPLHFAQDENLLESNKSPLKFDDGVQRVAPSRPMWDVQQTGVNG